MSVIVCVGAMLSRLVRPVAQTPRLVSARFLFSDAKAPATGNDGENEVASVEGTTSKKNEVSITGVLAIYIRRWERNWTPHF